MTDTILTATDRSSKSAGQKRARRRNGSRETCSLTPEVAFCFHDLNFTDQVSYRNRLAPSSPLVSNDLVSIDFNRRYVGPKELLSTDIEITSRAFAAMLGDESFPDEFAEFSSVEVPKVQMDQVGHRHLKGSYVFCDDSGKPLTSGCCNWPLYRACRKAGLRRIHVHVLRHTFASHLAMKGVPMKVIQELMGHSTIEMTMRYAHLSPEVKRDSVRLLDQPYRARERHHSGTGGLQETTKAS